MAADPGAAYEVLTTFKKYIYLYPTDVTRDRRIGFGTLEQLYQFLPKNKAGAALRPLYSKWNELVLQPRGELIFIHDLAPALGCAAIRGTIRSPFAMTPMKLLHIPHQRHEEVDFGIITIELGRQSDGAPRSLATEVDPKRYLAAATQLLASI